MVDYVSDSGELRRRLMALAFNPSTDEELAGKLQTIPGVEAEVVTQAAELLYAYRDKLDKSGLELLGQIFTYGNEQHWTTFAGGVKGSDNRAELIIRDVRRDLGELKGKVKPEEAPEPQTNRRDGFDWRGPKAAAPEPVAPSPAE